ncbi:MAG: DUF5719 family protein [Propionibacteriaceae bacterium]|jgi:hypothetical protein|nr:DUF5719 family protein [Propionibacteriaceae bacterium]
MAFSRRWVLPLVAAVVAGAAVLMGGSVNVPPAQTTTEPVIETREQLACPSLDSDLLTQQLLVASMDRDVTVRSLDSAAEALSGQQLKLDDPGAKRVLGWRGDRFGASAWAWAETGSERGLSAVSCVAPDSVGWITGVLSDADNVAELLLENLDQQDVTVDLTFHTFAGEQVPQGSRGVIVPAGAIYTVPLSQVLEQDTPFTVEIQASGRIAGFVRQHYFKGVTALGAEWAQPAAASEALIIPGIPAGASAYTLVVTNTNEKMVSADIRLLTADGALDLVGAESVDLPAGSTRYLSLPTDFADDTAALSLSAEFPITAAVLITGAGKQPDRAIAVAAPVLPAPATAFTAQGESVLSFANPTDAAAIVSLEHFGAGEVPDEVVVPATGTASVPLPIDTTVSVDVGATKVAVAVLTTADTGFSVIPLVSQAPPTAAEPVTYNPRTAS